MRRKATFRIAAAALLLAAGFAALGAWQLERRAWKHALIAQVGARVHAPPVAAPGPADWPGIGPGAAYLRVRATGRFHHPQETLVQAVTEQGGGFWVLTPLETPDFTVLVNRGFVPPERRDPAGRPAPEGPAEVVGLLRVSEPGGAFLRANAPAEGRWYSRDVAAIAAARGLSGVAPYFIDAEAGPDRGSYPVGGLTVIRFNDNHLVYALTWFGMAGLSLVGGWVAIRHQGRATA